VYVYAVLSGVTFGSVDLSFSIDGRVVEGFTWTPSGSEQYIYNTLVYSNISLTSGSHELNITNGRINGTKLLFILDRIVYS
jgi:hypothetical protein